MDAVRGDSPSLSLMRFTQASAQKMASAEVAAEEASVKCKKITEKIHLTKI